MAAMDFSSCGFVQLPEANDSVLTIGLNQKPSQL